MNKRILCLLLALCMAVLAVPAFVLPAVAVQASEQITFTFKNPATGKSDSVKAYPGIVNFDIPESLKSEDVIGWYYTDAAGRIYDWRAFQGTYCTEGRTFIGVSKTSEFSPSVNWPMVSNGQLQGYSGTWMAGAYPVKQTTAPYRVTPYNIYDGGNGILQSSAGIWGDSGQSGIYMNQGREIMSTGGAFTVLWTALYDGTVDCDFTKLDVTHTADFAAYTDGVFAIAKNGVVVWPAAAAGQPVDLTLGGPLVAKNPKQYTAEVGNYIETKTVTAYRADAAASKLFYAELTEGLDEANSKLSPKAGSFLAQYKAYCTKNGAPTDIEVSAGDQIQFICARVNTPHLVVGAKVTYKTCDENTLWSGVNNVASYSYRTEISPTSPHYPTINGADAYGSTVDFYGNWEAYTYNRSDYSEQKVMDRMIQPSFAGGEGGGDNVWGNPASGWFFAGRGGNVLEWGGTGSMISTVKWNTGWRYTAEHSGVINISFLQLTARNTQTCVAIFKNGTMIWPKEGGRYDRQKDWFVTSKANRAKDSAAEANACNTTLLQDIFVSYGDRIDIIFRLNDGIINSKSNPWWESYDGHGNAGTTGNIRIDYQPNQLYAGIEVTPVYDAKAPFDLALQLPHVSNAELTQILVDLNRDGELTADENLADPANAALVARISESGVFTLDTLRPQDIGLPIKCEIHGKLTGLKDAEEAARERLLFAKEINVAKMLYDAIGTENGVYDNAIVALLNYATRAQSVFGTSTERLANEHLTDEQIYTIPELTLNDIYVQNGERNHIDKATVLLGNKLGLKFMMEAKEGVTGYTLEYALSEDFSDAKTIEMVPTVSGKGYKAIMEMDYSDFSTAYYIRVNTTDAAGETKTGSTIRYSAESCVARIFDAVVVDNNAYYILRWMAVYAKEMAALKATV